MVIRRKKVKKNSHDSSIYYNPPSSQNQPNYMYPPAQPEMEHKEPKRKNKKDDFDDDVFNV